jgi:formylglycine-generating enzyme required for sulfatase activity
VQDYAEFAQAKGITPEKPKFEQGPTHPVVLVSWDSAKAFCEWLSQKEGRRYRLPTDAEWSIAVGLGEEIGKNPREKSVNAKGYDYPWGAQWPPPKGAGNFADETAKKVQSGWSYIEGYDDGYAYTSPVGSFAPNRFGLYDMGGNVWQWCEDWLDESKVAHTVRGGAWALYGPLSIVLRSSHRSFSANSSETTGFRCVLDLSVR